MTDIAGDSSLAKSIPSQAPKKSTVTVHVEPDGRTVTLDGRVGGPVPSSHSRYRLETEVTIVEDRAVAA